MTIDSSVKRFELPDNPSDGAAIDLVRIHGRMHRCGDFNLALTGYGFEASRYLTRDELSDLRDWITLALAQEDA